MDNVMFLKDWLIYLEEHNLVRKFIIAILDYPLAEDDHIVINIRGNQYVTSLYLYIKNKKNNVIIYRFINDYHDKVIHKHVEKDITFIDIYIKSCSYLKNSSQKLIRFSNLIFQDNPKIKDLLSIL